MNKGDIVTDARERAWTVEQPLGRGLWGRSWVVRDDAGRELVLKVPLRESDLPADAPLPEGLLDACDSCLREQADLLKRGEQPYLPRLEASFELPDGRPAMLLPRYASTLERRLRQGMPLGDTLALMVRVAERLEALDQPHGNLRPSNVLLNERGEPVLADLATPAVHAVRERLHQLDAARRSYAPPEANGVPSRGWDTWALCLAVFEAAMAQEPPPALPREGLDKVQLASIRDHALARLKQEQANPRFASRVAERLGSLLNRGISRDHQPSPPYRFETPRDLKPRLAEIASLVRPHVESVGRLLLSNAARDGVFQGGDDAEFSVTIGCSPGVQTHEHIACGLQVRDLDADGDGRIPVPESRFSVQTHPSGRMRFGFTVPGLAPGRYGVRVAFAIKDSRDDPQVAEGEFEVRPPPGYVPPADEPARAAPLTLPRPAPPTPIEADAAAVERDPFPTPVAPSSAGVVSLDLAEPVFEPSDVARKEPPAGAAPPVASVAPAAAPATPHVPAATAVPMPVSPSGAGDTVDSDAPPPSVPPDESSLDAPEPPRLMVPPPSGRPAVQAAPPTSSRPPASASPLPTEATVASDEPAPHWPADDAASDADLEPWVPGPDEGEDLPGWEEADGANPVVALVRRALDVVRRDPITLLLFACAGVLTVLLALMTLIRLLLI